MFKEGYDASSQQDEAAAQSNDLSSQVQADQIQARRDVTKTPALTDLATDAGAQAAKQQSDYLSLASIYRPTIETNMKLGEQTVASNPFASNFDAPGVFRKPQQTARNYYDKA